MEVSNNEFQKEWPNYIYNCHLGQWCKTLLIRKIDPNAQTEISIARVNK